MTELDHRVRVAEVVAVAESLEASAAEVYHQAAADATEERVRATLIGLAEMEEDHLRSFQELRGRLSEAGQPAPAGEEAAALLEAWVSGEAFPSAPSTAGSSGAPSTVTGWLETALGMEKESIAFYSGLREMVEEDHRAVVDHIIGEELYHIASLDFLLRSVTRRAPRRQHS